MAQTGVIRRIDELGRIVIPKEIRKRYNIDSGDLVEISILNDSIVLSRYHPYSKLSTSIFNLIEALTMDVESKIIITDRYQVIASSIPTVSEGDKLSNEFIRRIREFINNECSVKIALSITDKYTCDMDFYSKEVYASGEFYGYVLIFDKLLTKKQKDLANTIVKYLSLSVN